MPSCTPPNGTAKQEEEEEKNERSRKRHRSEDSPLTESSLEASACIDANVTIDGTSKTTASSSVATLTEKFSAEPSTTVTGTGCSDYHTNGSRKRARSNSEPLPQSMRNIANDANVNQLTRIGIPIDRRPPLAATIAASVLASSARLESRLNDPSRQLFDAGQQHEDDGSSIPSNGAVVHANSSYISPPSPRKPRTFGRHFDTALHVAIRDDAFEEALSLIRQGASVHATNSKRVTPLILAAQKGSIDLVRELLSRGASPLGVSMVGSSAILQAAHFGHLDTVKLLLEHGGLVELANYKNTTALMRAAQEGHTHVVQYLIQHGAEVNRRNNEHMSALMLSAQRGHARVCEILLAARAEGDAMTVQRSTSLMLACKREHVDVVKVMITAGCELMIKDSRGRTARDWAKQRWRQRDKTKEIVTLLDPQTQVMLMRQKSRVQRNYEMVQMWTLLQQERATIGSGLTIHEITLDNPLLKVMAKSERNLIGTMMLPAPMVELIASYMPLPSMWAMRLGLITRRSSVDPNSAVTCALDLINEVLFEGGFLEACDMAQIDPPTHFKSWKEWKVHCKRFEGAPPSIEQETRPNSLQNTLPGHPNVNHAEFDISTASALEQRRGMCFLSLLAHRSLSLQHILAMPPYTMPTWLIQQLITTSDIQSLSARLGPKGVKFEPFVAIEMIMLASSACSWFEREREDVYW